MSTFVFDSHAFVKRLRATGFTEEQAEAIVDVGREHLELVATKGDLQNETSALRMELQSLELRLTIKMGAMIAVAVGVILGALQIWR